MMIYLTSVEFLQTNVYDLDRPLLILYVHLSIYIILLIFFLFHTYFAHRILFFYILVQILCDIYNSILYVLNYLCPTLFTPPLFFIVQSANRIFIITKEGHSFKDSTLKLYRTPRLSGGFL